MMRKMAAAMILCLLFTITVTGYVYSKSTTKQMSIQGTVPLMLKYQITRQPTVLAVTSKDLSKGYVDSLNSVYLSVTTNNQNGYIIVVALKNLPFFSSAAVTVGNKSINIPVGSSGEIRMPYEGSATLTKRLSFRFRLTPEAMATQYEWPVVIMVNPI